MFAETTLYTFFLLVKTCCSDDSKVTVGKDLRRKKPEAVRLMKDDTSLTTRKTHFYENW